MKILKSPQKVLILLLTVFVIASSIFIVRLEIKAASLQSRLDEHHKSLEKNKDILENLDFFIRKIKSNGISIDDKKVVISADKSTLELKNDWIELGISSDILLACSPNLLGMQFKSNKIALGNVGSEQGIFMYGGSGDNNFLVIQDEAIAMGVKGLKDGPLQFEVRPKIGTIHMAQGQCLIKLHKNNVDITTPGDINITSTNGNVNIKGKKVNLNE